MGYTKRTRVYNITPRRKHIVKAVARRSKRSVATECMKDVAVKKYVMKKIGEEVRTELKKLSSESTNSILQQSGPNIMETFTWEALHSELTKHTPVLQGLLQSTGIHGQNRPNFKAIVALCVALLAKNRNPRMNLLAKIFSLIMYSGHSSKEVQLIL